MNTWLPWFGQSGCYYPSDSGSGDASRPFGVDPPGNHANPSDGSALKYYYFKVVLLTRQDTKTPRNAEQWWFAALFRALLPPLSRVHNSKSKPSPISGKSVCVSKHCQLWRGRTGVISILQKQLLKNERTWKLGNVPWMDVHWDRKSVV